MKRFSFSSIMLWAGLAFIYLPMVILVIYSFNASRLVTVWGGWSVKWYVGLLDNTQPVSYTHLDVYKRQVKGRGYERRNLRLPVTIESALERMEACKDAEKFLGEKFIRGYVAVKRAEHENFKRVISSWEREFLLLSV